MDFYRLLLKSTTTASGNALLSVPGGKTYRVQQKNTSNPIMLLEPCTSSSVTDTSEPGTDDSGGMPVPGVRSISTIEDTLELLVYVEESEEKPAKVNKWHEKFAKSRPVGSKGKE
jgi:sister chromatid cohesion protein DCC1